MTGNHVHIGIRDLPNALAWFDSVRNLKPIFQIPEMAIFAMGQFEMFLDTSDSDSRATIGFLTDDCDRDYARLVAQGAVAISAPEDKPYGVRAAYLKGPGAMTLEIEQPLKR